MYDFGAQVCPGGNVRVHDRRREDPTGRRGALPLSGRRRRVDRPHGQVAGLEAAPRSRPGRAGCRWPERPSDEPGRPHLGRAVDLRRRRPGPWPGAARSRFGFVPALDGLRAISVLGVMLYHGGAPFMSGGFLTIDVFFVLSGFLITSLLLGEWAKRLTIRLGQFWARRARRLLPALLVMLVGVAIYAKVFATPGEFANLRLDSLSTLFYVANWHFIFGGGNYFVMTAQPSPLEHMWSLSIEEQFYIVWPPVALFMLHLGRKLRPARQAVADLRHRGDRGDRLGRRHAPAVLGRRLGHAALRGNRYPMPGHPGRGGPGHRDGHVGRAPADRTGTLGPTRWCPAVRDGPTPRPGPPAPYRPAPPARSSTADGARACRLIDAWEITSPSARLLLQVLGWSALLGGVFLWTQLTGPSSFLFEGGYFLFALGRGRGHLLHR